MCIYIYTYTHICVYINIYIYIYTHTMRRGVSVVLWSMPRLAPRSVTILKIAMPYCTACPYLYVGQSVIYWFACKHVRPILHLFALRLVVPSWRNCSTRRREKQRGETTMRNNQEKLGEGRTTKRNNGECLTRDTLRHDRHTSVHDFCGMPVRAFETWPTLYVYIHIYIYIYIYICIHIEVWGL